MTYSQGGNPDDAAEAMFFPRLGPLLRLPQHHPDQHTPVGVIGVSPMWRLLRLRYVFWGVDNGFFQSPGDLPHVLLVDGWRRLEHRNDILAALNTPTFDGHKTVILEKDPEPAPTQAPGANPGTVRLLNASTDSLTIAANLTRPMLLLITDSYSRFWRATGLPGSTQSEYQVMPADYTLMAIPLLGGVASATPGVRAFRLDNRPLDIARVATHLSSRIIWWLLDARQTRREELDRHPGQSRLADAPELVPVSGRLWG